VTPLGLVSAAVAGDDLTFVARTAAEAMGMPVGIAIPGLGQPIIWPENALTEPELAALGAQAAERTEGEGAGSADGDAIATVRIGDEIVGIVAVIGEPVSLAADHRAWLEAAAAAASVTAVLSTNGNGGQSASAVEFLNELVTGPPSDLPAFLARAQRLGMSLQLGGVAICADRPAPQGTRTHLPLPTAPGAVLGELGAGRIYGLGPPGSAYEHDWVRELRARGMTVALSAPRRDPAALHEALREAELLMELATWAPEDHVTGNDNTYRLLIGVLLRDPDELAALRDQTISPLARYDDRHDTDLLETVTAFLEHDGSTTETAEAMALHRHTVGYRLARVHEVSGLSPYESDGRERLGLGLKARRILDADRRIRGYRGG
jgi:hypothetical protein